MRIGAMQSELRFKSGWQSYPNGIGTETMAIGDDGNFDIARPLDQAINLTGRHLRCIGGNDQHGARRALKPLTRELDGFVQTDTAIPPALDTHWDRERIVGTDDNNAIDIFSRAQRSQHACEHRLDQRCAPTRRKHIGKTRFALG